MRDINRIDGILDRIKEIWLRHPDLRLGQLISNGVKFDHHPALDNDQTQRKLFALEDLELLTLIEHYYQRNERSGR